MSEPVETGSNAKAEGRLAATIREVKNAYADRDDVVVDIREGQLTRLELLADDLKPVFDDIPEDDERFDLAISAGAQPRLWIDAVTHVTMARDRRTYRFLRDTHLGRVVLIESADLKRVADQVTRYIAGRIIERRRMLEGDFQLDQALKAAPEPTHPTKTEEGKGKTFLRGLAMVLLGGLVGAVFVLLLAQAVGAAFAFAF